MTITNMEKYRGCFLFSKRKGKMVRNKENIDNHPMHRTLIMDIEVMATIIFNFQIETFRFCTVKDNDLHNIEIVIMLA